MKKFAIVLPMAALLSSIVSTPAAPLLTSETKLSPSDAMASEQFGWSVSIDGDTAVVGALGDDAPGSDSGSAYVYIRSGSGWVQQQKLTASDTAAGDRFGRSVAISGDTIVVGASDADASAIDSGAAYIFVRSGSFWTQQQKLTPSDAAASTEFGWSVAISGDTAVVGTGDTDAAYVFVRSGGVWTQQAKLVGSDTTMGDEFGTSVSVSGDTALIGAIFDDDAGNASGSAYVFVRSGGAWSQQQKLTASDAATLGEFGSSVAISGDTALIGALGDDEGGSVSGAAYIFTRSGGVWSQQQKLRASDAAANDSFGFAVAISGDRAVIGATGDDHAGTGSGSAYLFARSAGIWSEQQKLAASDGGSFDVFGWSVSVSEDAVVAGAPFHSGAASSSGAAYVFEPDATPPTITGVTASPTVLWPPNHKMVPVTITVAATDDSGPVPTCRIISVTSSEPSDGSGDGHAAPDWEITGPLTANLRAERSGSGSGRRYTITVECTDSAGNSATASVIVTVPKSRR